MDEVFFISHPEVAVDPALPVPSWSLNPAGRDRMASFANEDFLAGVTSIWTSCETKAVEAGTILGDVLGLPITDVEALGENDRSATGFVPPEEFEKLADRFFADPEVSVRGWERAIDAQQRIRAAVDTVIAEAPPGSLAIVAHGGVGTLLLCHRLGVAIERRYDQPFQGHFWRSRRSDGTVLHGWRSIAPRSVRG